ncbi:efflux RND transporter permease subunit [Devosia psychrophila]|uniref:Hydrophobic/amphiphilic exporter-1, HAE1 family n=1 Tax=Devosia psychrophila TaxID=728005 RepID=A0A0F5Q1T9_9HYPH|nr:efflux RND transporter permease subunit [Devosia psychrophila]KKC34029.1 nodulation protein NolG [Devosia psychrophila]SFD23248.1 hydrophobic/amphiphilic exporter-1, HAE1 family [Devosia psychrophila]
MFLTSISVKHPVFATMIMVAIMVFGISAYRILPVEQYPDVAFPIVAVLTPYTGASPEAVETEITQPIEEAVNTLSGIDTVTSTSSAGHSTVILQFTLDTEPAVAAQDVRDRLAAIVGQMPDTADATQVLRYNPTASPMVSLALSSPSQSVPELTLLANDIVSPALTAISGVGSATVVGGLDNQVNIFTDPNLLNAFGIGVSDVISALRQDNETLPSGSIVDGMLVQTVQINAEVSSVGGFRDIIVASNGGETITIGDVATVTQGPSDTEGLAFHDGERALAIDVVKIEGGNTVAIAHAVEAAITQLNANGSLPADVSIDILQNSAVPIEQNFETVQATLIEGAVLAVVIVFLFLNSWRSTIITGLTLPISIIGTLTVVSMLGFTLNMMTMLALTLSVGILIDDAIVVRENITRHLHMGKSHIQAALDGTKEIGLAVLATTLSIVAVFLPLAFMDGIIGKFFVQFGVTVSVAVLISLFVSFTLDPMLSSVWYDPDSQPDAKRGPIGRLIGLFDKGFEKIEHGYRAVLRWSLQHRIITMLVALMSFGSSFLLFPLVGTEFMPEGDDSQIEITLETRAGSSTAYTAVKAHQVEALLADMPEVDSTYTSVNAGSASGENHASIVVSLVDPGERVMSSLEMTVPVREALRSIPGASFIVGAGDGLGGGSPIEVKLLGQNLEGLSAAASDLAERIRAIPGTVDVDVSLQQAQPMLDIVLDRQITSDLGIGMQATGSALRAMLGGETASEWTNASGDQLDVIVRLPEELRQNVEAIGSLPIAQSQTETPVAIRLDQIAQINSTVGPSEINRENLTRQVSVTADIEGRVLGDVSAEIDAAIAAMELPAGVSVAQGGDAEMLSDTVGSMVSALMLAVIFIYLVLASQFGSFLQPLAIMMALPMSLVGVMLGLLAGGSTLNMYSMIGFVMLMGLVVKNAILLVDNANQRRREGASLVDALIEAGGTRFRPIIMTTLAMIFGMLPLALAIHEGSDQSAPMAHAVIGGLISSTLLTLVVVPVMLTYVDALSRFIGRFLPKAPDHHEPQLEHALPAV